MTDDDDLRINTLHRFAKHSPKLVLHEYSHCEVPAGCGGVVLRWIAPEQGRPGTVRVFVGHGRGTVWLDGEAIAGSIVMLRPGEHCLATHVQRQKPGIQPFSLNLQYEGNDERDLIGRGAPRWRVTPVAPPAEWILPGFDDSAWPEPVPITAEQLKQTDDWIARMANWRIELGEVSYALAHDELWLRVAFAIAEAP